MAWPAWWNISLHFTYFILSFNLTPAPVYSQCDQALGLEDGSLVDSQFLASSVYNSKYSPWKARINSSDGWIASYGDTHQYLTVNLTQEMRVTEVAVQSADNGWFTRKIKIFYSLDNLTWHTYTSLDKKFVFTANSARNQVVQIRLVPEIKARFVAFNPVSYSGYPSLRLELFGCQVTSQTPLRHTEVTDDIEVGANDK
ncbi:neuropilin-2-like [Gigantopelta aegis]|uniref:neuropilin-2-like n=1 Tax=Gigantopelta aegis TaxID=1735272 RepID=UPI001B88A54C|nr:neuropilin-2-like [Gigantopelta aegis]